MHIMLSISVIELNISTRVGTISGRPAHSDTRTKSDQTVR